MARVIRVTIKTNPVAKARPRMAVGEGGKVWSYTPTRTLKAQEAIVARLKKYQDRCFGEHVPVKLSVIFYRRRGKWAKDKLPCRKPDLDNFLKLILDAMNGLLIKDDAQITSIHVKKRWAENGSGRISIKLEEDKDGYKI